MSSAPFSVTCQFRAVDLCCIRDDRVLFERLSFELNQGEALLLEGRNGSGKTSLLRILCGFRPPDAGELYWNGEALASHALRENLAYVGHLNGCKADLTVMENLQMALALGEPASDCPPEEALRRLRLLGYDDQLAHTLSAGQKRRLALARLLITRNRLWILDEPFTSLDRDSIAVIEDLMAQHLTRGGMIIVTSHHAVSSHGAVWRRLRLS